MHNYAKILIGFQQPSYSRWIMYQHGATNDSESYKKWPAVRALPRRAQQQMPCRAGRSAIARMVKTGLAGTNKEDKSGMGQSTAMGMRALLIWPSGEGLHEAFAGCWTTLSAVLPGPCRMFSPWGRNVRHWLTQQLNTETEMCDHEI